MALCQTSEEEISCETTHIFFWQTFNYSACPRLWFMSQVPLTLKNRSNDFSSLKFTTLLCPHYEHHKLQVELKAFFWIKGPKTTSIQHILLLKLFSFQRSYESPCFLKSSSPDMHWNYRWDRVFGFFGFISFLCFCLWCCTQFNLKDLNMWTHAQMYHW